MRQGEWADELLILSKGSARTEAKSDDGRFTTYDIGQFWGEMQFLGLEKQRSKTVLAHTYCEVASMSPAAIRSLTYGSRKHPRKQSDCGCSIPSAHERKVLLLTCCLLGCVYYCRDHTTSERIRGETPRG
jgi:hypothetical protein